MNNKLTEWIQTVVATTPVQVWSGLGSGYGQRHHELMGRPSLILKKAGTKSGLHPTPDVCVLTDSDKHSNMQPVRFLRQWMKAGQSVWPTTRALCDSSTVPLRRLASLPWVAEIAGDGYCL